MKILQILTDTNVGGAGIWLLNFLKSYDRETLDVKVVLPKGAILSEEVKKLGNQVIEAEEIADKSFSLSGIKVFKDIFSKEKPDIIHTHACISARIAGRLCGVKIVNTRHCLEDKKSFPKNIFYRFVNNFLSDRVIGVSKAVVDNLIDDGIKEKKVHLVYNGINPLSEISNEEKESIRKKYNFTEKNIVAGIVARLEEVKNHELFLKAAKLCLENDSELRFLIVGTGSLEDKLKEIAKEYGISDKVSFAGYIKDVNDITNIIDIAVLTSQKEALSIALIEAMSLGKPCVATNSGGPCEVIEDKKSGYIVENYNENKLADAILDLSSDFEKRVRFGEEGKKISFDRFSVSNMSYEIKEIYTSLLRKGRNK